MGKLNYKNNILAERERVYGDPVEMHEKIARLWSAILEVDIEATDVALMMIVMKAARAKQSPSHADSMVDVRGYSEIHDLIAGVPEDEPDEKGFIIKKPSEMGYVRVEGV